MIYRKFLLLVFFLFNALNAFPDVFVVTSNADSGPGTLREALTLAAANGSSTQDVINFSLPDLSVSGRTITLLTDLPELSSNVIIDGTTQPGLVFGISDAKVKISIDRSQFRTGQSSKYYCSGIFLAHAVDNIEIYGLYFTDYYYLTGTQGYVGSPGAAIYLALAKNIKIGAPGKGNVFFNNEYGIAGGFFGDGLSNNVDIKSNLVEFDIDGKKSTTFTITQSSGIALYANNVFVGGDSPFERNLIGGPYSLDLGGDNISVINNYLAVDHFDNVQIDASNNALIAEIQLSGTNIIFRNNLSSSLKLSVGAKGFKIYGNTDKSITMGIQGLIEIDYSENGIIGTNNINDINVITGYYQNYAIVAHASKNIQLLKNSIICSKVPYSTDDTTVPQINILTNNNTEYSGTATPNSVVYIYEDNSDCPACNPVKFYTAVNADASGAWKITGNFLNKKWVANTTMLLSSSEYAQPRFPIFSDQYSKINSPTCGQNNGSISLYNFKYILNIKWYNEKNEEIGEGTDITGLAPGKYYAKGFNGNCYDQTEVFNLWNSQPVLFQDFVQKTNPSCGQKNGSIKGLNVAPIPNKPYTVEWTDLNNNIVGTNTDIDKLGPGTYLFTFKSDCNLTYGPITLTNTTGPNIDQSNPKITGSNCGNFTGSITGITSTGTGTLTYSWKNEQQQVIATTKDLLNKPAGKYTLQVNDQSGCGPVSSSELTIPELNGITIDDSHITNNSATCSNNNGSITGIIVTGATSYQWFNSSNTPVSNSKDLLSVSSGTYYLVASNSFCSKQSANYNIINITGTFNYSSTKKLFDASCGLNNGSIEVIFTNGTSPKGFRWVNAQGSTVGGNSTLLSGIDAGTYQLYVTNDNGCETFYLPYTITRIPTLQFDPTTAKATDDNCTLQSGYITGAKATGGMPPYTYTWLNSDNKIIGTSANISHLGPGIYTLNVTDAIGCKTLTNNYTVGNQTSTISPPSVSNVVLCGPGDALVSVNNPSAAYKYRLYISSNAVSPVSENTTGKFTIKTKENGQFYISQLSGTCESARILVKISVGLTALNISNTFTPNNDGLNDTWKITGMENYPMGKVQIFNRNGQIVYQSTGYTIPFDGRLNGSNLPSGVYYYIINLNTKCDIISGSITIIR